MRRDTSKKYSLKSLIQRGVYYILFPFLLLIYSVSIRTSADVSLVYPLPAEIVSVFFLMPWEKGKDSGYVRGVILNADSKPKSVVNLEDKSNEVLTSHPSYHGQHQKLYLQWIKKDMTRQRSVLEVISTVGVKEINQQRNYFILKPRSKKTSQPCFQFNLTDTHNREGVVSDVCLNGVGKYHYKAVKVFNEP